MSSQNLFLTDMPDIVLLNILFYCDLYSILNLRKVCRSLRRFLNYSTPQKMVTSIEIQIFADSASMDIRIGDLTLRIQYLKFMDGCMVLTGRYGNRETWIRNSDALAVFCNDFDSILKIQGSIIGIQIRLKHHKFLKEECGPECGRWERIKQSLTRFSKPSPNEQPIDTKNIVLNCFEKTLRSRIRPLQVSWFSLEIDKPEDVIKIIRFADPKKISRVFIHRDLINEEEPREDFDIENLVSLEHWNSLEKIKISGFWVNGSPAVFHQMKYVDVSYRNISYEDLLSFKRIISESKFHLFIKVFKETSFKNQELTQAYGPCRKVRGKKVTCLEAHGRDLFIWIHLFDSRVLILERKTREEVTLAGFRLPPK